MGASVPSGAGVSKPGPIPSLSPPEGADAPGPTGLVSIGEAGVPCGLVSVGAFSAPGPTAPEAGLSVVAGAVSTGAGSTGAVVSGASAGAVASGASAVAVVSEAAVVGSGFVTSARLLFLDSIPLK